MSTRALRRCLLLTAMGIAAGCSDSGGGGDAAVTGDKGALCTIGQVRPCTCTGGQSGQAVCQGDLRFGPCQCGAPSDGGEGGVADGPPKSDGSNDGSNVKPMVAIPAGKFQMGCNATVDTSCKSHESPSNNVQLSGFEIDRNEVTQQAYKACVSAKACAAPAGPFDPVTKGAYPVTDVTRKQARDFCKWAGKRLPTEAEWEKAARGTDGRIYPWGNNKPSCQLANYGPCGKGVLPVGGRVTGASPYGVQDMAGNVWEWVNDWYAATYYQTMPTTDPKGPASGTFGVGRGGGWMMSMASDLRVSHRSKNDPTEHGPNVGFRCARDLP